MTALPETTEVVDPVPGAAAPHLPPERGSDAVQLLTPEGDRVEHPDYSLDISDEELRGLYRDLVLVRRWDAEATAQRYCREGTPITWEPGLAPEHLLGAVEKLPAALGWLQQRFDGVPAGHACYT